MRRIAILLLPPILLVRILNAESTSESQKLSEALTQSTTQESNRWLEDASDAMISAASTILPIVGRDSTEYQAFHKSMKDILDAKQTDKQEQMKLLRSVLAAVVRISTITVRKIDDEAKTFSDHLLDDLCLVIYSLVKAIVSQEFETQRFLVNVVERFRAKMLAQIEAGISLEDCLKMTNKLGNAVLYGLHCHFLSNEILDWST